ncbi:MAG: hypothetical protein ACI9Y1_002992 [Lentisphaeria bacterium]
MTLGVSRQSLSAAVKLKSLMPFHSIRANK